MIHRFIHFHEICKVSVAFPNNNKKANETSLTAGLFVSLNFSHSVRYVCAKHGAMGYFVTKPNIIFYGHVINLTFKMWHPKRGNLPQVKGKDKARFLQAAVCCSTYHKSTCRIEEVSGVAELGEPP